MNLVSPGILCRTGDVTINEVVDDTGGTPISGGGVWSTTNGQAGIFTDELTLGGMNILRGAPSPGTADQVFYETGNFVSQPLFVQA